MIITERKAYYLNVMGVSTKALQILSVYPAGWGALNIAVYPWN